MWTHHELLSPADADSVLRFLELWGEHRETGRVEGLRFYLDLHLGRDEVIAHEFFRVDRLSREQAAGGVVSFGPFQLQERLGRGGQGEVWLAIDTRNEQRVALKLLNQNRVLGESQNKQFRREAATLKDLANAGPGICQVLDLMEIKGRLGVAMRYLSGGSLAARLERQREARALTHGERPPSPAEVKENLEILEIVSRTLQRCHDAGILHDDLKPGNIMLDAEGHPLLVDFGIARFLEDGRESNSILAMGTPDYMAPERFAANGARSDRRSDVWSLGVCLYEVATGERPGAWSPAALAASRSQHKARDTAKGRNPSIGRDLDAVIEKALAPDPEARYQSALELADDLQSVLKKRPVTAIPTPIGRRLRLWALREPWAALVLLLVIAGLASTSVVLYQRTRALEESRVAENLAEMTKARARGDWRSLLTLAQKIPHGSAERPETLLLMAEAHLGLLDVSASTAALGRVQADDPGLLARVRLLRAELEADRFRDLDAGLDTIRELLQDGHLRGADAAYAKSLVASTVPEAVKELREALSTDPAHRLASQALAPLLILSGDLRAAQQQTDRMTTLFPEDPYPHLIALWISGLEGRGDEAQSHFEFLQRTASKPELTLIRATLEGAGVFKELGDHLATPRMQGAKGLVASFFSTTGLLGRVRSVCKDIDRAVSAQDANLNAFIRFHPLVFKVFRTLIPEVPGIKIADPALWAPRIAEASTIVPEGTLKLFDVFSRLRELRSLRSRNELSDAEATALARFADEILAASKLPALIDMREVALNLCIHLHQALAQHSENLGNHEEAKRHLGIVQGLVPDFIALPHRGEIGLEGVTIACKEAGLLQEALAVALHWRFEKPKSKGPSQHLDSILNELMRRL